MRAAQELLKRLPFFTSSKPLQPSDPFDFDKYDLSVAERKGIKPLSLKEILDQIGGEFANAVLFDTSPGGLRPGGNHWRVAEVVEVVGGKNYATLEPCSVFGNGDGFDNSIFPIRRVGKETIPLDTPLFTGVSIQRFELDGSPVNLAEVTRAVRKATPEGSIRPKPLPASIAWKGETILWSDSRGKLLEAGNHPSFKTS